MRMKVDVCYKELLSGFKQTVGALGVCKNVKMRLNLTMNYVERKLYLIAMQYLTDEAAKPDITAISIVPIDYIMDNNDYVIEHDNPDAAHIESFTLVNENSIGGIFEWLKKLPKNFEYITITVAENFLYFEQCDKYTGKNGQRIIDESAEKLHTACEPFNAPVDLEEVRYTDEMDGEVFLNIVEALYTGIGKLTTKKGPLIYIYFLNGTALASNGYITYQYTDYTGLKGDFILKQERAKCLIKMAKECRAEFLRQCDYNDFRVKIGLLNPETCLVTFVGVSGADEWIYGNMAFKKIELGNIPFHRSVTNK